MPKGIYKKRFIKHERPVNEKGNTGKELDGISRGIFFPTEMFNSLEDIASSFKISFSATVRLMIEWGMLDHEEDRRKLKKDLFE